MTDIDRFNICAHSSTNSHRRKLNITDSDTQIQNFGIIKLIFLKGGITFLRGNYPKLYEVITSLRQRLLDSR